MLSISIPAEVVFRVGPIPFTNSVLAGFLVTATIAVSTFIIRRYFSLLPGRIQVLLEALFEFMLERFTVAFGSRERARRFMPFLMTILLLIMIANQFSLVPFIWQITHRGTNILRLPTSDLSMTIALALLVVVSSHLLALSVSPLKHIGNYIKLKPLLRARSVGDVGNGILELFLGLLDIIGEIAKIVSLSCRLFGNMFAGEVMVAVIISLSAFTQLFIPIPFYILGIFSGFVQAFVFTLLSTQYIAATFAGVSSIQEESGSHKENLLEQRMVT